MAIIDTKINTRSEEFRANAADMDALLSDLAEKRLQASMGGSERARERHLSRGKLLPRDRVMQLIDPGTPLLELSQPSS